MREGSHTRSLVLAGLVAALLVVSAWVSIPIGSVPFTLQTFIVVLIALLLPPGWACGAVGAYLLAGAVGLPVFAVGRGGVSVLAGPTGGYLFGFLAGVWIGAWARRVLSRRWPSPVSDGVAAAAVLAIVYLVGWMQLAVVTGTSLGAAFAFGVAPFVLFDVAKGVAAVAVAAALRRAGMGATEIPEPRVGPSR